MMKSVLFIGGETFEGHVGFQVAAALRMRAGRTVALALGTNDPAELNRRFPHRGAAASPGVFAAPELRPDGRAICHFGAGPILERAALDAGLEPGFAAIADFFTIGPGGALGVSPPWRRAAASVDCLALSTTFVLSMDVLREMTALLKTFGPPVLLGGALVGKKDFSRVSGVPFDYCLLGEAEERLPRLFAILRRGGGDDELDRIGGLAWRSSEGLRVSRAEEETFDFAGSAIVPSEEYVRERGGLHFYESIRGCPYRCGFCDYPFLFSSGAVRLKSAQTMLEEWTSLRNAGVSHICAKDSLFTYPKKRIETFVGLMRSSGLGAELTWGCYSRARDLVDTAFVRALSDAGCRLIHIGLESGAQEILDIMNKRVTVEDGRRAVLNCRDAGIHTVGSFVLGYPGETEATARLTRDFVRRYPCDSTELFPWLPSFSEDTLVPVMQEGSMRRFAIERLENQPPEYGRFWGEDIPFEMEAWRHATMDWRGALRHTFDISSDITDGGVETEDLTYSPFRPWLRHPVRRTAFLGYRDHSRFLSGWRDATRAASASDSPAADLGWLGRSGFGAAAATADRGELRR